MSETATPAMRLARRVIGDAIGRQSADTVLNALAEAGVTLALSSQSLEREAEIKREAIEGAANDVLLEFSEMLTRQERQYIADQICRRALAQQPPAKEGV